MAEAAKSTKIFRTFSQVISAFEPQSEERLSRSPSTDSLPRIASRSRKKDGDPQAWEAKLKQVIRLSESTLEFLACVVKQHEIPLSPGVTCEGAKERSSRSSKSHDATTDDWSSTRRRLDKMFRSLATWRKDLGDDEAQFEDGQPLAEDIDGVFDGILAVARQLVRLVDLESSDWDEDDEDASELKDIARNLRKMTEEMRENAPEADASGTVASRLRSRDARKASTERDAVAQKGDYFEELGVLVSNLKLKSEPLQLALRRRDWERQAARCREQAEDADRPRKKPSSKA